MNVSRNDVLLDEPCPVNRRNIILSSEFRVSSSEFRVSRVPSLRIECKTKNEVGFGTKPHKNDFYNLSIDWMLV